MLSTMKLNERALQRCQPLIDSATELRVVVEREEGGARLIDCGVDAEGGLEAGRALAEVCMAGLARVDFVPGQTDLWPGPAVTVTTDQPIAACMASQYAGWQIAGERYFAMGSGPMRAVRGREPLLEKIGFRQRSPHVVGVLESAKLPPAEVCMHVADECGVQTDDLTLLVAPTSSLAGSIQVVARTIETALHKMFELGFDLFRVTSGYGVAPLPPVAADDLTGIGRTNDAVLYGGRATLWVRGDDANLAEIGPHIPSSSSVDHGQPFAAIFERYGRDFYKIDPLLFSPAVVTLVNLDTGRSFSFGETRADVLRKSFLG
jgi:methenyltetrahydromethanopterin cyclohydrolase